MIFNIRGTHGSGKSTLVTRVMALYDDQVPKMVDRRKRPIGYYCTSSSGEYGKLFVLGAYDVACGGCDTISGVELVYDLVKMAAGADYHVIFEGAIVQGSLTRLVELKRQFPTTVIALSTPRQECIDSVIQRRKERGQDGAFDPKNIEKDHFEMSESRGLHKKGLYPLKLSREAAYCHVENALAARSSSGERIA